MLPRNRGSWLVVLTCVAIALAFGSPTVVYCGLGGPGLGGLTCRWSFNHNGSTGDWRYFAEAWEAARVALVDFHQFPSWNPYHCGGLVLFQDPQSPFPGPMFLLTFWWLPTGAAIKVWILSHLVAGTLGARALIKDRGGNGAEQILGAVLMAACGFVAWHTGGGHLSFTPFLFFPTVLWAWRRSLSDARWAVLVAALFALAFYEGATYPIPLMLIGLGVETAARLGSAAERRALLPSLAIFGALFPLLAGLRLVPVLAYLHEHPRLVPLDDSMTLGEVFKTWLLPMHERAHAGHVYVWDEYGDYVGILPVALMLAGVAVAFLRRDEDSRQRRIDLALLVVLVWCAFGNIPGPSLFGVLHELPIYKSLRVPSRFLGPAMVGFALVAVSALMAARRIAVEQRLRAPLRKALAILEIVLVLGIAVDVCVTNAQRMQQGIDPSLVRRPASSDFFQAAGADYGRFPSFPMRGFGTRQCYVPLDWKPAPGIVEGKIPQQRLEPVTAGAVTLKSWSPNAIELEAALSAPAILIVNQNYETGWRASTGTVGAWLPDHRQWTRAADRDGAATPPVGMLSVALPAGKQRVILRHRPPGLGLGLALVALGIAAAVALLRGLTPQRLGALRTRVANRILD